MMILRDDEYVYTDCIALPADHPRADLERLASDLAVADQVRRGGQRVAPESVPDVHLDIWWRSQVLGASIGGCIVALRAQPLRQDWAPLWGAAILRRDGNGAGRGELIGVRVLAEPELIASWSPNTAPAEALRDVGQAWCAENGITEVGHYVETVEMVPVTRRAWVSVVRIKPANSGGPGEE